MAPIGETCFGEACARVIRATWIKRQISETSTLSPTLKLAYYLRCVPNLRSDFGMDFELALQTLKQGMSCNEDGKPQFLKSHELLSDL